MALPSMPDITALSNRNRPGVQVKEERPEDAEIQALAAKMVEANKAKMAISHSVPLQQRVLPGPGALSSFFSRRPMVGVERVAAPSHPGMLPPQSNGGAVASQSPTSNSSTESSSQQDKQPFDMQSQMGKFSWVVMGGQHIPYIFRGEEKYTAVRMVESKLLVKYLSSLNSDIYNCTCIRSYYITDNEARLLTEINSKHCESKFGPGAFSTRDLVVRLKDAEEFYLFLEFCYGKLTNPLSNTSNNTSSTQRCGFIRINSESVVPYALTQEKQFVPLFYFDGETDTLKDKAVSLEGWDLAYLKFCCKVQGIRSELFESDTCVCISLDHIKNYFAGGTVFEEYWPPKLVESSLLVGGNQRHDRSRYASWTKAPPPQPSPPSTALPAKEATNGWPHSTPASTMPARYYRQTTIPPTSAVRSSVVSQLNHMVSNNNLTPRFNSAAASRLQQSMANSHYYSTATQSHGTGGVGSSVVQQQQQQPPPALVRVTAPPATHLSQTANYSTSSIVLQQNNSLGMMATGGMMPPPSPVSAYSNTNNNNNNNNNNTTSHKNYAPPPLIPVNGTSPRYYSGGASGTDVIDLSSPPQSPQRSASLIANGSPKIIQSQVQALQQQVRPKYLIQISETSTKQMSQPPPFKMLKASVNGKMVPCINAKAFVFSDLLMTVNDLLEHFFPQVPVSKCREVLQDVLNVELYAGNTQQKSVLRENNKMKSMNEEIPLIQLKDVITYMPQLTYVMGRMSPGTLNRETENHAKRQRVS